MSFTARLQRRKPSGRLVDVPLNFSSMWRMCANIARGRDEVPADDAKSGDEEVQQEEAVAAMEPNTAVSAFSAATTDAAANASEHTESDTIEM